MGRLHPTDGCKCGEMSAYRDGQPNHLIWDEFTHIDRQLESSLDRAYSPSLLCSLLGAALGVAGHCSSSWRIGERCSILARALVWL